MNCSEQYNDLKHASIDTFFLDLHDVPETVNILFTVTLFTITLSINK